MTTYTYSCKNRDLSSKSKRAKLISKFSKQEEFKSNKKRTLRDKRPRDASYDEES